MQKTLLTAIMLLTTLMGFAQPLFTYGTHQVSREEFLRAYTRNNAGPATDQSMREYLELYIRFKLKVQAAKDAKMDTLPHIKNDIAGFRAQVIESYMRNEEEVDKLIAEAFERNKEEIEIAHVFVAFGSDSLQAKATIQQAWNRLKQGAAFGEVAAEFSTGNYVKRTSGYVGFITAFTLPYEIETAAYALQPGSYSAPVKGPFGYHIIRSISRRKSSGIFKGAHILISFPPGATRDVIEQRKQQADSVYQLLKNGGDFAQLASRYSDDKMTYLNGGILPEFNIAQYDGAFTQAAFALKQNGDFTEPVYTDNGYHIILRHEIVPVPADMKNPETEAAFNAKVGADSRINIAIEKMKAEVMRKTAFKQLPYNEKTLWALTDSMLKAENYAKFFSDHQSKPVFNLGSKMYSVGDWLRYAKAEKTNPNQQFNGSYPAMMRNFIEQSAVQFYKDRLEQFSPEFSAQMKEFSDGSLLFEIMEKNIWSKAPADSAGLLQYYQANRGKYNWEPGVSAIIYNCADTSIAASIVEQMKKDPKQWKNYMDLYGGRAIADSGRFELTQLPLKEKRMPAVNSVTEVVVSTLDGSASFCYIVKTHEIAESRSFEEAKGLVINDYQLVMEEKWIEALKKKYPVKVNEAVVQRLTK